MLSASRLRLLPVVALLSLVAPSLARAASTGAAKLDIGRLRIAPDATGGFAVSDPRGLAFGQYALNLTFDDEIDPLVLERDDGQRTSLVPNRFEAELAGIIGLYGPLSIGLELPIIFQSGSLSALPPSTQPLANGALSHAALGDLRLVPRLVVLNEAKHGLDLAVNVGLTLPTGQTGALTSDGGIAGEAFVSAAKDLNDVRLMGELGVRFRPTNQLIRLDVGNELLFRVAGDYSLEKLTHVPLHALAEIDTGTLLTSPFSSSYETPAEWRVGARYCAMNHLALTAGVGGGLSYAYGTPLARFLVGVGFDPRVRQSAAEQTDGDHDGISDAFDKCPEVPGDAAHDGCPPPPPAVKTAPVDSDGDGIQDSADQCPTVQGTKEFNGCPPPPPPDADDDGIFDADDWCPMVPGPIDLHGCPSADEMKKAGALRPAPKPATPKFAPLPLPPGLPNALPRPPVAVPHAAGDRDGDGVLDAVDNCPNEGGPAANHGCRAKQLVSIGHDTIDFAEGHKVQFNGTAIAQSSNWLLVQAAALIKNHPEFGRIRVEGHTDNSGGVAARKKRSQDEAESVKTFLVGHGVPADRLDAQGFGDSKPIAPNLTRKGREANERIELHITGSAVSAPGPALAIPDLPLDLPPPPPAAPKASPKGAPMDELALPPLDNEPALTLPTIEPKASTAPPQVLPPPAPTPKPAMAPPSPPAAKPAMAPPPATTKPAAKKPATTSPDDLPLPSLDELPPLDGN